MLTFFARQRQVELKRSDGESWDSEELEELCKALRIISQRDVDKTVVRVFKAAISVGGLKSGEVAKIAEVNRITAIHHLQRLENAGVLEKEGRVYKPGFSNFEELFEEFRKQVEFELEEARQLAIDLDRDFQREVNEKRSRRKK
jgi:predicted transcriptional regulator